ncbi:elongation factor 1-gamma 1 family protein [Dorcoceras hygrometricum]|uniref:Elongation factor 1-gamma 1 family protein n=1 Tax=Dorcoceras hygrometricum TaxID=472368 RepID=A0A2Z7AKV5_9LAMI|nr:elongation factor 1-gamma 1 family protein [Dorcoceras hygrometricum]
MQTALAKADHRLEQPKLRTAGYSKLNPVQQCPILELYAGPQTDLQIKDQLSAYPGQITHTDHTYGSAHELQQNCYTRYKSDCIWKANHQKS